MRVARLTSSLELYPLDGDEVAHNNTFQLSPGMRWRVKNSIKIHMRQLFHAELSWAGGGEFQS